MLWMKLHLEEFKMKIDPPLKIYCDNNAAINISHNHVHHDRTKHVEVDRHFIKEKIEAGILCITYVPTSDQVDDVLTKALAGRCLKNGLTSWACSILETQLEEEC